MSGSVVQDSRAAWSIAEVARRHGVSPQFVRLEIKRGHLRAKKVSRRVLITSASEKAWIEAAPDK